MALDKMDWQKNLLIAAMIAVLFMLVIRWNDFQENLPEAQGPGATATDVTTREQTASDIASLPADNSGPVVADQAAPGMLKMKGYTDRRHLEIDTQGGDITYLARAGHYAALRTAHVRSVLLDDRNNHADVAQNGLIGPHGTDTPAGPPTLTRPQDGCRKAHDHDLQVVHLLYQPGDVSIPNRF